VTISRFTVYWRENILKQRIFVLILIDELEASAFIPLHTFGRKPISAKLSFLLFLWYITNTDPLRNMSDRFSISISSVFRVLRRVIAWLLTKVGAVINWPQEHGVRIICEQFNRKN